MARWAAVDINEVGKVRLTDTLLRRILHVSLDAPTHGHILPTPCCTRQLPLQWAHTAQPSADAVYTLSAVRPIR